MPPSAKTRLPIHLAAALASLLLSLLAIWQNPWINTDGVHYLRAIEGNAESIHQIGGWLFYSRLIGGVAILTGLEPETAAYLLNTLLDLLLVLAFLRFVEEAGANRRVLAWAALLILALPYLNDNRPEIIRDHGYWAFTLVALIFWLRLLRDFSWKRLLGWNLAMGAATLFRVEGIVFLALMPLGLLLQPRPWRERLRQLLLASVPVALGAIALLLWAGMDSEGNRLTRLLAHAGELGEIFTHKIPARAEKLSAALPDLSTASATWVLYLSVLFSILKDLGEALSWPLALLLLLRRRFPAPSLPQDYLRLLIPYSAISLLVLFVQGSRHFIMVSRYTMALALVLLPVGAWSLDHLWQRYRQRETGLLLPAMAGLALLWMIGDSLIDTSKPKPYIMDAAHWAVANLPRGSKVLTDYDPLRLDYYAEKTGGKGIDFQRFKAGRTALEQYDYAFVRDAGGPLAQKLGGRPASLVWRSGSGSRDVRVYRLR